MNKLTYIHKEKKIIIIIIIVINKIACEHTQVIVKLQHKRNVECKYSNHMILVFAVFWNCVYIMQNGYYQCFSFYFKFEFYKYISNFVFEKNLSLIILNEFYFINKSLCFMMYFNFISDIMIYINIYNILLK